MQGETLTLAGAFHVRTFVTEEIAVRGWSRDEFVLRMCGGERDDVTALACEFLLDGPDDPDLLLGDDMAQRLARTFHTSPQLWLRLEAAYRAFAGASPVPGCKREETDG